MAAASVPSNAPKHMHHSVFEKLDISEGFILNDENIYEITDGKEPLLNTYCMGWTQDGRCGFPPNRSNIQDCPHPVYSLKPTPYNVKKSKIKALVGTQMQFITQSASAGHRHSLLISVNCRFDQEPKNSFGEILSGRRTKKIYLMGLNQQGLCEEPGHMEPVEIPFERDEEPIAVCAGNGVSFIVTRSGNVYSFGIGRYGVLGHGDQITDQVPRQIKCLNRVIIKKVSAGGNNAAAITYNGIIYTWGQNNKGQCGRGKFSPFEATPSKVETLRGGGSGNEIALDIACGFEHTCVLILATSRSGVQRTVVYGWGDCTRGQLGSADPSLTHTPQENRWLSRFLVVNEQSIKSIVAGGYHNLALTAITGEVISWGAGDYGQLGNGFLWDNDRPGIINELKEVIQISAGRRFSMALRGYKGTREVLGWGYNGYGELGLNNTDIKIYPTKVSAFNVAKVVSISAGDRHVVVVTQPKPIVRREDPELRKYFDILEEAGGQQKLLRVLKHQMVKNGLDPTLLDDPDAPMGKQAGINSLPLMNDAYETGLRYCLDTKKDPNDWRHKTYEVYFDCRGKNVILEAVCLSCARFCVANFTLTPKIRFRHPGDENTPKTICECRRSGMCVCSWSRIRDAFDGFAGLDQNIGPNQIRPLLQQLRSPTPVAREEIEECCAILADGDDTTETPRIKPVVFEKWYRLFYSEFEDDDDR